MPIPTIRAVYRNVVYPPRKAQTMLLLVSSEGLTRGSPEEAGTSQVDQRTGAWHLGMTYSCIAGNMQCLLLSRLPAAQGRLELVRLPGPAEFGKAPCISVASSIASSTHFRRALLASHASLANLFPVDSVVVVQIVGTNDFLLPTFIVDWRAGMATLESPEYKLLLARSRVPDDGYAAGRHLLPLPWLLLLLSSLSCSHNHTRWFSGFERFAVPNQDVVRQAPARAGFPPRRVRRCGERTSHRLPFRRIPWRPLPSSSSPATPCCTLSRETSAPWTRWPFAANGSFACLLTPKKCQAHAVKLTYLRQIRGTLSAKERIAYTDAVRCLMAKPSKFNSADVPGAKSRYDDFVAVHINQTLSIHGTANFLSWHRWIHLDLRAGPPERVRLRRIPAVLELGQVSFDPLNSPIFDGSATSMSGNGVYQPHNRTNGLPHRSQLHPAPATRRLCPDRPLRQHDRQHMGPIAPTLAESDVIPAPGLLAYNPRCLKRDVSQWVSSRWTTDQNSTDLILQNTDVGSFQTVMQGDFANGVYGVHKPAATSPSAATAAATSSPAPATRPSTCTTPRSTGPGGSGRTRTRTPAPARSPAPSP